MRADKQYELYIEQILLELYNRLNAELSIQQTLDLESYIRVEYKYKEFALCPYFFKQCYFKRLSPHEAAIQAVEILRNEVIKLIGDNSLQDFENR